MTLPYPSRPLTQLQPDRLAVQARLRGLRPAPPSTARVLEIGCADAGNLAALAAYAPDAEFVGVDVDPQAVADAPMAPNLRVLQADLNDLALGQEFDYVMAHGVYSWIPQPRALIDCLARHLAPNGVGYVSYDCLPGAYVRVMAGEVVRRESQRDVERARSVMEFVTESAPETDRGRLMRMAMTYAQSKPDYVLAHDELQTEHHPVYFDDFVQQASECGLHYVGEAHLADCAPGVSPDRIRAEQWSDYASGRPFRQSLLSSEQPAALGPDGELYVSAPVRRVGKGTYQLLGQARVETDDAALIADFAVLARVWPAAVPWHALASDPSRILQLYAARAVDLRSEPVVATRPDARPFVVEAMRGQEFVSTCRHEPLRLDEDARRAVAQMDGSNSRNKIAAAVGVTRVELDSLIDGLSRAGLFVTPPAASAC